MVRFTARVWCRSSCLLLLAIAAAIPGSLAYAQPAIDRDAWRVFPSHSVSASLAPTDVTPIDIAPTDIAPEDIAPEDITPVELAQSLTEPNETPPDGSTAPRFCLSIAPIGSCVKPLGR